MTLQYPRYDLTDPKGGFIKAKDAYAEDNRRNLIVLAKNDVAGRSPVPFLQGVIRPESELRQIPASYGEIPASSDEISASSDGIPASTYGIPPRPPRSPRLIL